VESIRNESLKVKRGGEVHRTEERKVNRREAHERGLCFMQRAGNWLTRMIQERNIRI
jgi:hypothetical protein